MTNVANCSTSAACRCGTRLTNEPKSSPPPERWGDSREWVGVYDYLCGTANHPSLHAVEYFDWTNPAAGAQIPHHLLNRLLRAALVPYLKALEYLCAYMGWSTELLDAYIDRVNAVLGTVLHSPAAEEADAL
jgi:hypothetical protein